MTTAQERTMGSTGTRRVGDTCDSRFENGSPLSRANDQMVRDEAIWIVLWGGESVSGKAAVV